MKKLDRVKGLDILAIRLDAIRMRKNPRICLSVIRR
jgi:hypothetical protein